MLSWAARCLPVLIQTSFVLNDDAKIRHRGRATYDFL